MTAEAGKRRVESPAPEFALRETAANLLKTKQAYSASYACNETKRMLVASIRRY